jgi:hypothetical protein
MPAVYIILLDLPPVNRTCQYEHSLILYSPFIDPIGFCLQSIHFILSKESPTPPVPMLYVRKQPLPNPSEKGISAYSCYLASFSGSVVGPTIYCCRHIENHLILLRYTRFYALFGCDSITQMG